MTILLVDDDPDMLDVTAYALRRDGFNIALATNGLQALRRVESDPPELVLLDIRMPKMDGFEVCQKIRQDANIPVIILSAASDEENIIQGFARGADDYVTKPFSPKVLMMRIRAVLSRFQQQDVSAASRGLRVGDLVLDLDSHQATRNGKAVHLTPLEFRTLYALASNWGRVITFSRLVEYVWGYDGGDASILKTHISHIRTKLDLKKGETCSIDVVPGVGYRLSGG